VDRTPLGKSVMPTLQRVLSICPSISHGISKAAQTFSAAACSSSGTSPPWRVCSTPSSVCWNSLWSHSSACFTMVRSPSASTCSRVAPISRAMASLAAMQWPDSAMACRARRCKDARSRDSNARAPTAGQEPVPTVIDQPDPCDGHVEQVARELGDVVKVRRSGGFDHRVA